MTPKCNIPPPKKSLVANIQNGTKQFLIIETGLQALGEKDNNREIGKNMAYENWQLRNGALLIEKYTGKIEFNQIIKNDDEMLNAIARDNSRLLLLTDISQASLKGIDMEEIGDLFKSVDAHGSKTSRMKIAIYTGLHYFDDFQKAGKYALHGASRSLSIIPFVNLDVAMNWLGLSKTEQEWVLSKLRAENE